MSGADNPVADAMSGRPPRPDVPSLADQVVTGLMAAGVTVATAESLTGGGVCEALTSVPGASQVVIGSVVSYATGVKRDVLGVEADLLARRGAVDAEVAEQMARGVAGLLGSDWAVATTGSAGPEPAPGGSEVPDIEPGTVYIAVHARESTWVERLHLTGDRDHIRAASVEAALRAILRTLDGHRGS